MKQISVAICIMFNCACFSQTALDLQNREGTPPERRAIRFYAPNGYFEKVDFYDTTNWKIIKSFNIIENNPYNKFDFPVVKQMPNGYMYYQIPEVEVEARKEYWLSSQYLPTKASNLTPGFVSSNDTGYDGAGVGFAVVGYRMLTFNTAGVPIAFHSTYYVFDSKGEIISTFEHLPEGASGYVAITDDGKYLFASSGAVIDCSEGEIGKPKFDIYDVKSKARIYEAVVPDAEDIIYPKVVNKNMILIRVNYYELGYLFRVIDLNNDKIYEKKYPYDQYKKLHYVGKNGIYFKDRDGRLYMEKYTEFSYKNLNDQ